MGGGAVSNAMFAGFVADENYPLAFIVVVENGGYGAEHVIAYDSGITDVQALMNGQIDCVIIDNAPAQEFVKSNPGLTILDGHWAEEDYAIGVDKGNTVLLDAINKALAELIADGTVQSIIDKYIH